MKRVRVKASARRYSARQGPLALLSRELTCDAVYVNTACVLSSILDSRNKQSHLHVFSKRYLVLTRVLRAVSGEVVTSRLLIRVLSQYLEKS